MSNTALINGTAVAAPEGAIAYKYADETEDAHWIYDEDDLRDIAGEDPNLIVFSSSGSDSLRRLWDRRMVYGLDVRTQHDLRPNDLIGEISLAPVGNVIIRIGRENNPGIGWSQIAHVVLAPDEARRLGMEILRRAEEGIEIVRDRLRKASRGDDAS